MMVCLAFLRLRHSNALEIDYDPVGVSIGAWAPGRAAKLIHHHHEILFADDASRFERPARRALPRADLVIVADEGRRGLMMREKPGPRSIATVRNLPRLSDALRPLPRRDDRFSVVYFGAMGRDQCLDTILASVREWPPGVRLHLYGRPPRDDFSVLSRLAAENGVADRLVFEGWIAFDRLIDTVARHHVGLSLLRPSNNNWRFSAGASNKRYLLMAAGVPQISDQACGVAELVAGNGVGTCVPYHDPQAIAAAVHAYAADPARVAAEGEAGRALIRQRLNYEREFRHVMAFALCGSSREAQAAAFDPSPGRVVR
ncbi:glycosyltransferase [Acuticoccus sp. M5D2P5]|uniref:glycosyltransferase n=1 Tax=Acuticoccus kalidii TaxID=2910977 RepID=UPI001F2EC691|nr:glycosyltransferase [Acuticoccus kalidii]MCF3936661.1 glycosyltransferase [Acuticoccus kalidii]